MISDDFPVVVQWFSIMCQWFTRCSNISQKNIMIINDGGEPKEHFNTQKYNKPIMDTVMMTTWIFLGVGGFLTSIVFFTVNDSTSDYVKSFWYKWARNIFFRTIVPILVITLYHKDFQHFLLKTCHDMWSNVCIQNNRIHPILPQ